MASFNYGGGRPKSGFDKFLPVRDTKSFAAAAEPVRTVDPVIPDVKLTTPATSPIRNVETVKVDVVDPVTKQVFEQEVVVPVRPTTQTDKVVIQQQAEIIAEEIVREQAVQTQRVRSGRVYTRFDQVDDILANNVETVTRGLFFGNTGSLTVMFTSSNQTATQEAYYQDVFSVADPALDSAAKPELSIAYGHFAGSGSKDPSANNTLNNDTPSRAIYKQFAQTLLNANDKKFTDGDNNDFESAYFLTFNRARFREKLDPGNFELTLALMSGSAFFTHTSGRNPGDHTGSAVKIAFPETEGRYRQIIDDSSLTAATLGESGQVYNLVSGSIDGGTSINSPSAPVYYGLLYPQHGVAVLNGGKLDEAAADGGLGFATVTGSQLQGDNAMKLFTSLSSSNDLTINDQNGGIQARSSEQVKSTYYFVRAKNADYNYSNNPSYVTGSLGQLLYSSFKNDPQTYITSVGMYNNRRELLAVAKLSQPLLKNFTREALIKVKLDF